MPPFAFTLMARSRTTIFLVGFLGLLVSRGAASELFISNERDNTVTVLDGESL